MKKQSGFTLIELVVAMAVLGLIMGAMVHLFGSSVTSLHVGARQEVVYEEARLLKQHHCQSFAQNILFFIQHSVPFIPRAAWRPRKHRTLQPRGRPPAGGHGRSR